MSKIHIIFLALFLSYTSFSQEKIEIKHLGLNINTLNSEFSFFQIDDSTAFYTSSKLVGNKFKSDIFKTKFKNNQWQKGKEYFYSEKSRGNLFFDSEQKLYYFTECFEDTICKIKVITNSLENKDIELAKEINYFKSKNTQPHIAKHESQNVLYFASDRVGGYGGMDIWFCILDKNGNYGEPINAGDKINSAYDEVTPFYNIWTEELFFSRGNSIQKIDFDIYKAQGKLNLWKEATTVDYLNSNNDDLYLSFYNQNKGYFASNRDPAITGSTTSCCNDIFSFEYKRKDNQSKILKDTIQKYLPLTLYFHNDEPDPKSLRNTTNKTYKETYISYYLLREEYLNINPNPEIHKFFEQTLKQNYNTLSLILESLLKRLIIGERINIYIKGYASPLFTEKYNNSLSNRRIHSLLNYFKQFKNGRLNQFFNNKQLQITQTPYGETRASSSISSNPKNKIKSIYSIEAMRERKIEIIEIEIYK